VREQRLKSYLEHICGADNVGEGVLLSTKSTFRVGGPARFFVVVKSKEKLVRLISALEFIQYPYRVLGAESDILATAFSLPLPVFLALAPLLSSYFSP